MYNSVYSTSQYCLNNKLFLRFQGEAESSITRIPLPVDSLKSLMDRQTWRVMIGNCCNLLYQSNNTNLIKVVNQLRSISYQRCILLPVAATRNLYY